MMNCEVQKVCKAKLMNKVYKISIFVREGSFMLLATTFILYLFISLE